MSIKTNALSLAVLSTVLLLTTTAAADQWHVNLAGSLYSNWKSAMDVEVRDTLAYVLDQSAGLTILNITDPDHPTEVGRCYLPGTGMRLEVSGDYAYIAAWGAGMLMVDVTNPANPSLAGAYNPANATQCVDLAVNGQFVFTVDGGGTLRKLDVSNPGDTRLLFSRGGISSPYVVGYHDGLVYVEDYSQIQIIDADSLRQIGQDFRIPGADRITSMCFEGDLAYFGTYSNGVFVVSVVDPANPSTLGSFDFESSVDYLQCRDSLLYCAVDNFWILDVRNPNRPRQYGYLDLPSNANGIALAGNRVLVANQESGLRVIDISNPEIPAESGSYAPMGCVTSTTKVENTLLVAVGADGMRLVDVTDPAQPVETAGVPAAIGAYAIATNGLLSYVAGTRGGLRIVDVTNPNQPIERGVCRLDGSGKVGAIQITGDYAFAVTGRYVNTVNCSDPTHPTPGGLSPIDPDGYGLFNLNQLMYFAQGTAGLRIWDVSHAPQRTEIGFYNTPGRAYDVTVSGHIAYVADYDRGVSIIDVSDSLHPREIGYCETPGNATGVAVLWDNLFVADGLEGLRVFDVSDPRNPIESGYYDTPGEALRVTVDGHFAYVSDFYSLQILDVQEAMTAGPRPENQTPTTYSLLQPFPNPFNSTARLGFELPVAGRVALDLLDINGRQIQNLQNQIAGPGHHEIIWNAAGVPAGVYLVRMSAGDAYFTRKVVLQK